MTVTAKLTLGPWLPWLMKAAERLASKPTVQRDGYDCRGRKQFLPAPPTTGPSATTVLGDGLSTTNDTKDFNRLKASVANTLGRQPYEQLSRANAFQAHARVGRVGAVSIPHLQGRGRLRLSREQCEQAVFTLPLPGISEERINGRSWRLAEPGTG